MKSRQIYCIILFGSILISLYSCKLFKKEIPEDDICGLATPILLTTDSIKLDLSDYFTNPEKIWDIGFPAGLSAVKGEEDHIYYLGRSKDLPAVSTIDLQLLGGNRYSILVKNLKNATISIRFNPEKKKYHDVRIRGSMNRWNAKLSKMHRANDGSWIEDFSLPPGEYQYLIVADGEEICDPANAERIDNNLGGFNSLLKVGNYRQEELPFITTKTIKKRSIVLESDQVLSKIYALWQNEETKVKQDKQRIIVDIPYKARTLKRSFIRVIGYNETGISNDILIPLEQGKIVTDPSCLDKTDRQTMIMYFMMIDRFSDGDTTNNKPVADPEILPKANYFGGDIQGINAKLLEGYFTELGINTLWLSPIVQNPLTAYGLYKNPHTRFSGYHGYWPISSTKIDFRLGDSIILKELIDNAHASGMNVLLDYVASHVHELHPVYKQHPKWATPLYLPDGTMNTERWDEYRLTTWFDTFLPKLDLSNPRVANIMSDSALFWIKNYGIDGFRHDATKHIDELFWRILTRKIKDFSQCNPMPYQIGETYGSPELISSYIGSGMLDAQFDFNVYDDEVAVFARDSESFARLKASLTQSLRYYGYHSLMGYISGNQDRPRFISLAGGDLLFGEDTKLAGWTRKIGVGDTVAYKKLMMLQAFNLTIPGIPTIYYGDEIGLPGGNDPDNRRWMKFDSLTQNEKSVKELVSILAHQRSINMALLYGDLKILQADEKSLVYIRTYFDDFALMVFNKTKEKETIAINISLPDVSHLRAIFKNPISDKSGKLSIEISPNSFEMIIPK